MHAFTMDVEDWYQSCVDYDAPITERVVRNVDRALELLDAAGVRGTFFVQGRVAEAFPALVAGLVAQGHEVQSHGYSHRPLDRMSWGELRQELQRAKTSVEDAAGTEVTAFRAQDFTVGPRNLWVLETLAELGFRVDSSIFPMRTPRYGIAGWPLGPRRVELAGGTTILEAPVAIWSPGRLRVPVGGGGYMRLLPERVLEAAFRSIADAGRPAILYCHPYEFAPGELAEHDGLPRRLRASQEMGRRRFAGKTRTLIERLPFGPLGDVLAAWGIR